MVNYYDDNFDYMAEVSNNIKTEVVVSKTNRPSTRFFCDEFSLEKPLNNEWSVFNLIEYLKNQVNFDKKMETHEVSKSNNQIKFETLESNKPLNDHDYYDGYFTLTLRKEAIHFNEEKFKGFFLKNDFFICVLENKNSTQIPIISTMHHFAKIGGFYELAKSIRFEKTFSIMKAT